MTGELEISRRRLPHWTMQGSTYFITWRLVEGVERLNNSERQIVLDNLMHFQKTRYILLAYVVMDDHVHVVCRPLGEWQLAKLTHSWKSYTANMINKNRNMIGTLWQDERFDRLIRDEDELTQKMEYVLTNPIRRWPDVKDYAWVGWIAED